VPPGVDNPEIATACRSGDLIAPDVQNWLDAYEETLNQALHPALPRAAE
jgi:hypothetical protein